ncbi:DHH family phosphoesterase [Candidatus Bathyarchaeota archaeon]|nr:DHH family phosphoesterase [Candidatus Bathyarchaeota archaeon]
MATWIFTHGDGDGLCAGAIALAANRDAQVYFTHPFGLLEDLENASEDDKVIICDIALSEHKLPALIEKFSEIASKGTLIYIDHHPLPETFSKTNIPGTVLHRQASASELAYQFFQGSISNPMDRLAIIGAVADYMDKTSVINKLLCNWDKRTVYFETGVLVQGIEGRKREYGFKRELITHLAASNPPSTFKGLIKVAAQNTRKEETQSEN